MPAIGITGGISTGKSTFWDCLREIPEPNFSTPMRSRVNLSQEQESLRTRPLKTVKFLRASRRDSTSSGDRPAAPELLYVGALAPSAADVVSNGLAKELVRCSVRCGRGRGKASDRGLPGRIGITIGPARNKFQRAQLAKLILDRRKPKTTHSHQFAHISFLMGRCEKQSQ